MNEVQLKLLPEKRPAEAADAPALPLTSRSEPLVNKPEPEGETDLKEDLPSSRALALADFAAPRTGLVDSALRIAYRLGVPPGVLASPFAKPGRLRVLAAVAAPTLGDPEAGIALRAGHLTVHGVKAPLRRVDFGRAARLAPPFARKVHAFDWLRDLAACAPAEQCADVAAETLDRWLKANPAPAKGPAWTVEHTGQRLLATLVHAPLLMRGDRGRRTRLLEVISVTARWLDRQVASAEDGLGQVAGWCAIVAAGLLLPDGRARRVFGEPGLLRALGELVSDDGGVLSRSPLAQMDAIALLVELKACYAAVGLEPPGAIERMPGVMVPPLLALAMGDGALGSWQGSGATSGKRLAALVEASGVRARPSREARHWGYHRLNAAKSVVVMDAAPPPRPRHARFGCASTLAFEFAHAGQRIVVNCGGSELAGGLVPLRIEQGLRASAAHSTLVLDEANSTAILIKGQIGKGVEEVDVSRARVERNGRHAQRIDACHNGYAARYGLVHRRALLLAADGLELQGEDVLAPSGRRGKRGKIAFAIRFHLAPGTEPTLTQDERGAGILLPDGSRWQFRLGGDSGEAHVALEESLWVDGSGRPHATRQIVVEGMAPRSGGVFPWLFKKMG